MLGRVVLGEEHEFVGFLSTAYCAWLIWSVAYGASTVGLLI